MRNEIKAMSYDELVTHAEEVLVALRQRAYSEGYKQGRYDAEMDAIHTLPIPNKPTSTAASISEKFFKEPQAKRDEIIEKAKRDIEKLKRPGKAHGGWWDYRKNLHGSSEFGEGSGVAYRAEFIVSKEKRTVVVLLKDYQRGTKVLERGIAKADPSDCFNVHIGKAIALRRALALEVPAEYLNAPQPTEVRVGDVVEYSKTDTNIIVIGNNVEDYGFEFTSLEAAEWSFYNGELKILDDSRDGEAE